LKTKKGGLRDEQGIKLMEVDEMGVQIKTLFMIDQYLHYISDIFRLKYGKNRARRQAGLEHIINSLFNFFWLNPVLAVYRS
jgi:NAD-dependent DNA ligase